MAYFSVAQSEYGPLRHDADSPAYQTTINPIDQDINAPLRSYSGKDDHLHLSQNIGLGFGPDIISQEGKQSYAIIEDEDEDDEVPPPPPLHLQRPSVSSAPTLSHNSPPYGEQVPVRTASVSKNLPLKHPTPDLQSLQGAYLKNVERLEESAERLSITSSLVAEIEKMKQEQKNAERQSQSRFVEQIDTNFIRKFSSVSASNSIIGVNQTARNGGYSPAAYVASPTGSMRGSIKHFYPERRPSQAVPVSPALEESEREDLAAIDDAAVEKQSMTMNPETESTMATKHPEFLSDEHEQQRTDRPGTSNSDDTCRQANALFNDFDGVHYSASLRSSIERAGSSRQISINRPPLARDSVAFREPQPGEHMIYYPAPVPVVLNLPQRISKATFGEQERRRLKGLSAIPVDMRQAAPWHARGGSNDMQGKPATNLPPQLRAQAYFEQPGLSPNLQLKDGSAVATLDSLLDAAAFAPVSAFVDHPIVGQLGQEVYGPESPSKKAAKKKPSDTQKRRTSFGDKLKPKRSSGTLSMLKMGRLSSRESKALENAELISGDELDQVTAENLAPSEDEVIGNSDPDERTKAETSEQLHENGEDDEDEAAEEEENELTQQGFNSAPTTLLAELQMRKAQQKLRNRTAADAFPNGMHSTLLELDAVTQLQQRSRKQKHVTLAWEDQEAADRQNFDDEEVPLGVLFPEKDRAEQYNANRPIGLLEKREIEDNEPLSHRRARLRGEPIQHTPMGFVANQTVIDEAQTYKVDIPGLTDTDLPEQEEETLAQRVKRMKEQKEKVTGGDFAADVSSELGLGPLVSDTTPSKTPEVEETLGQRRKRLKEEAARNVSGSSPEANLNGQAKPRYNMADLLHAHPTGLRQVSNEHRSPSYSQLGMHAHVANVYGPHSAAVLQYPRSTIYQQPATYFQSQPSLMQVPAVPGVTPGPIRYQYPYHPAMPQYGAMQMIEQPLDPRQRAMIDQWRQDIF